MSRFVVALSMMFLGTSAPGQEKIVPAKGVFLVAKNEIEGGPFYQSVVLLLAHSDKGTLGLIVNRTMDPWILCLRLPASLSRRQPHLGDLVTLAAPTRQMRRVQALSTQKSRNIAVTLAGIRLTHHPQLVLRGKASTLRLLTHFRIRAPRRIVAGAISGTCQQL